MRRNGPKGSLPILTAMTLATLAPGGSQQSFADERQETARPEYHCGTKALYALLKFEGRSIAYMDLVASLPTPTPSGHSMRELREAARSNGIELVGAYLPKDGQAPDRPALAFLRNGPHGHYVTIRPVGHSGKLVQVIDANRVPYVLDVARLYSSPGWTGLVLIPIRRNRLAPAIAIIMAVAILALGPVVRYLRSRTDATPNQA